MLDQRGFKAVLSTRTMLTIHVIAAAASEDFGVAFWTHARGLGRRSFCLLTSEARARRVLFASLTVMERDVAG